MTRRPLGGPIRSLSACLAAALCLALTACAGLSDGEPEGDDGESGVPLPPPAKLAAAGDADTTTTPPTKTTDPIAGSTETAASADPVDTPADPPTPVAPPPPTWFPPAGHVVRLAGLAAEGGARYSETRTVRAGDGPGRFVVDIEIRRLDGSDPSPARESYEVDVQDDEIRIALAPDPLRAVPPPARELPVPPKADATWRTPAGTCRIVATDETVETFLGTRTGCARVVVAGPTGRRTMRWFDPQLGEVRRELRDRKGRVVAAWALCGTTDPAPDALRKLLIP